MRNKTINTMLKRFAALTWILVLVVSVNATTISSSLASFTTPVEIANEGTNNGLYIDQNGNGIGLFIDNAGSAQGLYLQQTGSGRPLYITKSSDDANRIEFRDTSQGSSNNYIGFAEGSNSGRRTLLAYRNLGAANTGGAVGTIIQDNSGDDQNALNIQNDGTGNGLFIDQNGDGAALNIDSEATTEPAIKITLSSGGCAAGDYGLYTDASGDLYWCKNGVGTKLN